MATDDPATPRFVIGSSSLSAPRVASSPRLAVRTFTDEEDDNADDEPTVGNQAPVAVARVPVSQAKTDPGGRTFVMRFGRAAS